VTQLLWPSPRNLTSVKLPSWLDPLPDAAQQRALDEWAIRERQLGGPQLMERAGRGLADLAARHVPEGRLVAVCGKGNNGGDGLVAARLLREAGREVDVVLTAAPAELQDDARLNLQRLPGDPPREFQPAALDGAAGVLDALLGTGFSGIPRASAERAIEAIGRAAEGGAMVIACDVPSGVDASTGEVQGRAVRAHATATFHAAKPGLWISPGKQHAGEVTVIDIGIPPGGPVECAAGLLEATVLEEIPRRGADSTKFAAGSVLVCGGSRGLTGAPCLACEAAMRAGAGYVTACVPESLNLVFEVRLLEVMSAPLPDHEGALGAAAAGAAIQRSERARAMVLGPGLGRAEETLQFARDVARRAEVPLVLDADGLNAHAGQLEALHERSTATVITPHAGELARLLGSTSEAVGERRLVCAREAARRARAIVVLKGDDTLIARPDGLVAVSRGGSPALATAGTGDVLSGVVAALLAKEMDPFAAACAAVLLHAEAGRVAARRIGSEGVIARDVIEALPGARGYRPDRARCAR
jgi:hydroxyethylthiazole kinase-like uncharacterized protein yjeF